MNAAPQRSPATDAEAITWLRAAFERARWGFKELVATPFEAYVIPPEGRPLHLGYAPGRPAGEWPPPEGTGLVTPAEALSGPVDPDDDVLPWHVVTHRGVRAIRAPIAELRKAVDLVLDEQQVSPTRRDGDGLSNQVGDAFRAAGWRYFANGTPSRTAFGATLTPPGERFRDFALHYDSSVEDVRWGSQATREGQPGLALHRDVPAQIGPETTLVWTLARPGHTRAGFSCAIAALEREIERWLGLPEPEVSTDKRLDPAPPEARIRDRLAAAADSTAEQPRLNFPRIAQAMAELVDDIVAQRKVAADTPLLTIGVFGPWGAGKSTLFKAIEQALKPNDGKRFYPTFTINPWKWTGEGSLHTFVRDSILRQARAYFDFNQVWRLRLVLLARDYPGLLRGVWALALLLAWLLLFGGWDVVRAVATKPPDLVEAFDEVLKRGTVGAVAVLAVALALQVGWPAVTKWAQAHVLKRRGGDLGARGISEAYADVARLLWVPQRRRDEQEESAARDELPKPFVIFIDDLDRCPPSRVATVIESVHSLTAAGCIIFIACDEKYIAAALNARYERVVQHHEDGAAFGRSFLEKIVQVPFRIPLIDAEALVGSGLVGQPRPTPAAAPAAGPPSGANLTAGGMIDERVLPVLPELEPAPRLADEPTRPVEDLIREVMSGLVGLLPLNFRQVKAYTNSLKLYLAITGVTRESEVRRLAAFVLADRLAPRSLDARYAGVAPPDDEVARQLNDWLAPMLGDDRKELERLYRLIGRRPAPPLTPPAPSRPAPSAGNT